MRNNLPNHVMQADAESKIIYLMDAVYALYRATYGEDPVMPEEVSIALGWNPLTRTWVRQKPNIHSAKVTLEEMLKSYFLDRFDNMKSAASSIITEALTILNEIDWTPCTCHHCKEEA